MKLQHLVCVTFLVFVAWMAAFTSAAVTVDTAEEGFSIEGLRNQIETDMKLKEPPPTHCVTEAERCYAVCSGELTPPEEVSSCRAQCEAATAGCEQEKQGLDKVRRIKATREATKLRDARLAATHTP